MIFLRVIHPTSLVSSKCTVLFWVIALGALSNCSAPSDNQQGKEVYQKHCAGCHGPHLQGSAASALIKETLRFGNDRNSIINVIRNGIPMTEMIKWDSIISKKEIAAVADYILAVRENPETVKTDEKPLKIKTIHYELNIQRLITEGMEGPWGIEFVDSNHALISGKMGDLYWMVNNKLDTQKITGLPLVYGYDLFGGMMDLALDPDYSNNGWIYLAFSHNTKNTTDTATPGMTKIVRGKVKKHQWVEEQTLFEVHDSLRVRGGMRWGSRFLFDKQGYLYFTIGDMQQAIQTGRDPQMLTRPQGKIFRIHSDGSIPKDNPLYGRKNVLQAIYAWGTRNVQGIAQHPVSGKIYFTDHGPQGGDELNLLKKGANYGWPLVTYGVNYDGSTITKDTAKPGLESPLIYWTPSIAVCAVEFANSHLFPKWQNNLLITALKFEELRRLVLEGDHVKEQEILLKGYGRVRDVKIAPDGALYVLTNMPDALLRITPE
jgi:glucose/arabinose dehydrogenase